MNYKVKTKEELEKFVCENWNAINTYIDQEQSKLPQPLTSSVDVRESKYKFAPVDHNMYPAGFNNLCNKDLLNCSTHFRAVFNKIKPDLKNVAVIPESHTKNKFYLDHLYKLSDSISMSESEVTLISPDPEMFQDGSDVVELESQSEYKLKRKRCNND
jgi:glutamate--cysteine ligase